MKKPKPLTDKQGEVRELLLEDMKRFRPAAEVLSPALAANLGVESRRTLTVYRFKVYDISTDENRISRRWATLEAIEKVGGEALRDTATEVDRACVDTDIPGMTDRDFDPHASAGFERTVSS